MWGREHRRRDRKAVTGRTATAIPPRWLIGQGRGAPGVQNVRRQPARNVTCGSAEARWSGSRVQTKPRRRGPPARGFSQVTARSIYRASGARRVSTDVCTTCPDVPRATGSVRDARPCPTRRGCDKETLTLRCFGRVARARSANTLVARVELSSMIPPRTCGRTLAHSAPTPSRHAPSCRSPSRRVKTVSAVGDPKAPWPAPPRSVSSSVIHPTRRPFAPLREVSPGPRLTRHDYGSADRRGRSRQTPPGQPRGWLSSRLRPVTGSPFGIRPRQANPRPRHPSGERASAARPGRCRIPGGAWSGIPTGRVGRATVWRDGGLTIGRRARRGCQCIENAGEASVRAVVFGKQHVG